LIIDAHVHIWPPNLAEQLPKPAIDAQISTLLRQMSASGVDAACAVTSRSLAPDNSYLTSTQACYPRKVTVVAVVDLLRPELLVPLLDRICGVRFPALRNRELDLNDADFDPFWNIVAKAGLTVCLHMDPKLHVSAYQLAARFPQTRFVVDHLGRPDPRQGPQSEHFQTFLALANCRNIACKTPNPAYFSQLGYPYHDLLPFYRAALLAFGTERVMWASDWPWITLYGPYRYAFEPLASLRSEFTTEEWADVMGETFRSWFPLAQFETKGARVS
jgi:L-fuconolactonase